MDTGSLSLTVPELWCQKSPEIIRISRICVNNRPQEYTAIRAAYLPNSLLKNLVHTSNTVEI
jgi:hypothetical protein